MRSFAAPAIVCAIACLGPIGAQADTPPTMGAVNSQASRQVDIPPIILDACKIEYSGGLVLGTTGKLDVEFTNESSVVADLVRIRVNLMDSITNVRDVGVFSPGVSIKHKVRNEQGETMVFPFFGGKKNRPHCSIVMVHFKDGSTWMSPTLMSDTDSSSSDPK
jgi:hypothetical protein